MFGSQFENLVGFVQVLLRQNRLIHAVVANQADTSVFLIPEGRVNVGFDGARLVLVQLGLDPSNKQTKHHAAAEKTLLQMRFLRYRVSVLRRRLVLRRLRGHRQCLRLLRRRLEVLLLLRRRRRRLRLLLRHHLRYRQSGSSRHLTSCVLLYWMLGRWDGHRYPRYL